MSAPAQHGRVKKLAKPVLRWNRAHSCRETLWWSFSVPMRHGALGGWRASQPEALHACLDLIHEAESKGWT